MNMRNLVLDLEQALAEIPALDIHTHLVGGKLGARGLHDILLYHMVVSDLYAAGCSNGGRLTQYPAWPESFIISNPTTEKITEEHKNTKTSLRIGNRFGRLKIVKDL